MSPKVHFSKHAVRRYAERFRPALSVKDAERELAGIVNSGRLTQEPAEFLCKRARKSDAYFEVGDAVFPVTVSNVDGKPIATTCLAPRTIPPAVRAWRKRRKRRIYRYGRSRRDPRPVVPAPEVEE